jgi:penicillin-binding protein 1A
MTEAQDSANATGGPKVADSHHKFLSRSATGARVFLRAVRHDLSALRRRLGARFARPATRAGRSADAIRSPVWKVIRRIAALVVFGLLAMAATILSVLRDLPPDRSMVETRGRAIALEAADGQPLGRIGPLKIADASREEFPRLLVMAVLSIEDRRFYDHWGVDLQGIVRAAWHNFDAGTIVEGGSTITQQLVKMRLSDHERTYGRKLRQAFLALWLEMHLSKDEILTRYLNGIYMRAGAQGVPAAARLYFDKRPSELTLPEAALFAGLIKAPSRFNPLLNPELAIERAALVLDAMVDNRVIDRATANDAKAHPAVPRPSGLASSAGTWFSDWVASEAMDVTGAFAGSMRVRTTLVPDLQHIGEQVIADALSKNAYHNVAQAALVAMRPDGAVVAMVGGRDYKESPFNRAVQAKRQPGSAFKLFVYMAALRDGLTLEDPIDAGPLRVGDWQPENYGGRQYATVSLGDAFARSINTAAVRLSQQVGLDHVIAAARDLGITSPLPKVPSLALGSSEVSLLNLTTAYAAVLAGRAPVRAWGVTSFASPTQPRLMSVGPVTGAQQPLGHLQATLTRLLQLPIEHGTAREAKLAGFAAGKTGTTQDDRDAWFIGFNNSLVVGIWVGNDDRSPMRDVTGGSLPAVMWKDFMTKAAGVRGLEGIAASSEHANAPTPAQTM